MWLKDPENLRKGEREHLAALALPRLNQKTVRAWDLKLNFQELFQQPPEEAEVFFEALVYLGHAQPS